MGSSSCCKRVVSGLFVFVKSLGGVAEVLSATPSCPPVHLELGGVYYIIQVTLALIAKWHVILHLLACWHLLKTPVGIFRPTVAATTVLFMACIAM